MDRGLTPLRLIHIISTMINPDLHSHYISTYHGNNMIAVREANMDSSTDNRVSSSMGSCKDSCMDSCKDSYMDSCRKDISMGNRTDSNIGYSTDIDSNCSNNYYMDSSQNSMSFVLQPQTNIPIGSDPIGLPTNDILTYSASSIS